MTPVLWLFVGIAAAGCFALGAVTGLRWHHQPPWHSILAVVFAAVGLAAAIDLAHLQTQFSRHVTDNIHAETAQVSCNTKIIAALVAIADARRTVDEAATHFDAALTAFLNAPLADREPGDPAAVVLAQRTGELAADRVNAAQVYRDHPFPTC